jgi:hypothetical protein
VTYAYPCWDWSAGCDQGEVRGSRPGIGKAENADGGNWRGNPFLSNILKTLKFHYFPIFDFVKTLSLGRQSHKRQIALIPNIWFDGFSVFIPNKKFLEVEKVVFCSYLSFHSQFWQPILHEYIFPINFKFSCYTFLCLKKQITY